LKRRAAWKSGPEMIRFKAANRAGLIQRTEPQFPLAPMSGTFKTVKDFSSQGEENEDGSQ